MEQKKRERAGSVIETMTGFLSQSYRGDEPEVGSRRDSTQEYILTNTSKVANEYDDETDEDNEDPYEKRMVRSVDSWDSKRISENRSRHGSTGEAVPTEWYTYRFHGAMMGFDLEMWWRRSPMAVLVNALFLALLIALVIVYLCSGIVLIYKHITEENEPPYTCHTEECYKGTTWMTSAMNFSVDPCHNFYDFICGNYQETGKEGDIFWELITTPAFKLEFGGDSVLAKMLKNFQNDTKSDQPIKFYQRCLDYKKRYEFRMGAFYERVEYIFGTRDFTTFESTTRSFEEMGANLFRTLGNTVYINLAFFVYPFIQIVEPIAMLKRLKYSEHVDNRKFVKLMMEGFMPELGIPIGDPEMNEMVEGIGLMSDITFIINKLSKDKNYPVQTDSAEGDAKFVAAAQTALAGYCPPMGMKLDFFKMIEMFIDDENMRITYISTLARKYILAFKMCFEQSSSAQTKFRFTRPKTAFVAVWLFGMFIDFFPAMDEVTLVKEWDLKNLTNPVAMEVAEIHTFNIEFRCLNSLWKSFGYTPSIRYLQQTFQHPNEEELLQKYEVRVMDLFRRTHHTVLSIPFNQSSKLVRIATRLIMGRGLFVNMVMPLIGGVTDTSLEDLHFTDDHLNNRFLAYRYTIEKGRQNWMGNTNPIPYMRFYGAGEPFNIRDQLFDLKSPMIISARFNADEKRRKEDLWEKFLGRRTSNYILLPLSIYDQPHTKETSALDHGGVSYKIIRSILSLMQYKFWSDDAVDLREVLESREIDNISVDRTCYTVPALNATDNQILNFTEDHEEKLIPIGVNNYTWFEAYEEMFFNVVALKLAFHLYRDDRAQMADLKYSWKLPKKTREKKLNQLLPGEISKYTQDQQFFMGFVRHSCRGSWHTAQDEHRAARYKLEVTIMSTLMQTKEFATAWNCPKESYMNNLGKTRCCEWNPHDEFVLNHTQREMMNTWKMKPLQTLNCSQRLRISSYLIIILLTFTFRF